MPRKGTEYGALARLAHEATDGEVDEGKHLAGRVRLIEAIEAERGGGQSRTAMRAALAMAAAVALIVGGWGVARWRAPDWTVDGAVAQGDGFVRASSDHTATIHFADGSAVALAPATRARVVHAERRHVVLEDGRAEVRIPRGGPMLAWAFDAGPFTVKTSPGAVTMQWSGDDEQLDVWPTDAETTVQGGVAGSGVTLHGGDHLTARVRQGELRVVRADGQVTMGSVPAPPSEPSSNAIVTTMPDDTSAPPSMPSSAAPTSRVPWSTLVARGDYDAVLREATASGLDGVLETRPLSDLTALADATRYRQRPDVARRALLAERKRFTSSKEARTAAFLLGRLEDDQSNTAAAIPWYDRYLAEAPNGPFASDALGRKMIAVDRLQGPDAARSIADRYARKWHGAYAAQAESLRSQ